MKSMTGHGRGEASHDGHKITVEMTSVNRKQSEVSVSLPDELEPLEAQVRDAVNRAVARGKLTVRVSLHGADGRRGRAAVNAEVATAAVRELRQLAKKLKLAGDVSIEALVRVPGVFETEKEVADAEAYWPSLSKALDAALAKLVAMRGREGTHLAKDLKTRMAVAEIRELAPGVTVAYRDALVERIRAAGIEGVSAGDERLLKEVALFADRCDISEELTRLGSHFKQFDDLLASSEPAGRTLDFLIQEMNREVNTIGSKANDAAIARQVIHIKAEFEKIREQVQNIE